MANVIDYIAKMEAKNNALKPAGRVSSSKKAIENDKTEETSCQAPTVEAPLTQETGT